MRKIFVVGHGSSYANWMEGKLVDDMRDADLIVFTGGEDVSPVVYNDVTGEHTMCNITRDTHETRMFRKAKKLGIPMIGICRGSQLLCALSGGKLVQHQQNKQFVHDIFTREGRTYPITSTHHQAQYPYNLSKDEYTLLAWTEGLSEFHLNGEGKEISDKPFKEVEICFYPKTKCLCIQGHPEMMMFDEKKYRETLSYLRELLNNFLNNKL